MAMATTLHPSSIVLVPTSLKEAKPLTTNSSQKLLANCKTLNELKQLHCDMMKKGLCHKPAGKWTDVARVRLQMKEKGIQKVPGSSSIEVHGLIHEFTSGDESHTENTQIELMLQEINCRLRGIGYVPDTTNVLLDVDEHEKEHLLSRHSEKLAMAYGLITTSQVSFTWNEISHGLASWRHTEMEPWITQKIVKARKS
ncbi:hypothetical protein ACSQ67_002904 [Phaseolus vulgaris]